MKHLINLFVFLFFSTILLAQPKGIEISGKVVESNGMQAIEFVTVMIGDNSTQEAITGVTTDENGFFSVRTKATDFFVELSFIGFTTIKITDYSIKNGRVDLGTIILAGNAQQMDEIVVRAEKSNVEFKLDKSDYKVASLYQL